MELSKISLFALMNKNMSYLNSRQDVLSQNVANANTPGYKAKDLKEIDFAEMLTPSASGLSVTDPRHISGVTGSAGGNFGSEVSPTYEVTPTGNQVVLEEEVMKISKTTMEYQQTSGIYRKMLSMLKMALGDNNQS